MLFLRGIVKFAGLLALALCLGGCARTDAPLADENNTHFQHGRTLASGLDYKGAAAEFEQALVDNPRSAAAHFELACLDETKLNDSAAAIYHYQRHLQLETNSEHAAEIKDRIHACRMQLASEEFSPQYAQRLQHEVDRLNAENLGLRQQLTAWQRQASVNAKFSQVAQSIPLARSQAEPVRLVTNRKTVSSPAPSHPKIHIVQERETITKIAAEYGLRASSILAANPRVSPRRLRVGQSLYLP